MDSSRSILEFLRVNKPQIAESLEKWILEEQQGYRDVMEPMHSAFRRSIDFSKTGKMIRGALVLLLSHGYSANHDPMPVAIAMELFQSFLLIHDDIMDRDPIRRGNPAVYVQYASDIQKINLSLDQEQSSRYGEALGICVGDVVSFLGYQAITNAQLPDVLKLRLLRRVNYELTRVGLAQMQDVTWSASYEIPGKHSIFEMYINKTGRYTFTLPFLLGGLLGGADDNDLRTLEKLGDTLGILFQIRDDELGILGDTEITGKPQGSDLQESKKTIYLATLLEKADEKNRKSIQAILLKDEKSDEEITLLTNWMFDYGVFETLKTEMERLSKDCNSLIDSVNFTNSRTADILKSLVFYCKERDK